AVLDREVARDRGEALEPHREPVRHSGQALSIVLAVSATDLPSANHAVIAVHSAPEPTAAGIMSEASNRNVAFGSVRYLAARASTGWVYTDGSTSVFADTEPGATLIRLAAQAGVDRYSWTAWTSGRPENAVTNSPPPSTGVGVAPDIVGR